MEYIYKITTTGSNNNLKFNANHYAYLREFPFTANTYAAFEIDKGIFSFNVQRSNYYQLWSGISTSSLSVNNEFCNSTSAILLFGNDVTEHSLTGTSIDLLPTVNAISSSLITLSSSVSSLNISYNKLFNDYYGKLVPQYNSVNSYIGDVNRFTLTSNFIASTAYLYNLFNVTSSGLTGGIILQKASGTQIEYDTVSLALSNAVTGDIVKLYKSITANIGLPDQIPLYIAPKVMITAQTINQPTIYNTGKNFKITGQGIIRNNYDGIDYTGRIFMVATGNLMFFTNNAGSIFKNTSYGSTAAPFSVCALTSGTFYTIYYNSGTGFVGGGGTLSNTGLLFKTTNSGNNWSSINIPNKRNYIKNINFFDSTTGIYYVGGDFFSTTGAIHRTTDGGNTWTPLPVTGYSGNLWGVNSAFLDSTTGFIGGGTSSSDSIFYKTVDSGATWETISITSDSVLTSIKFIDSTTGFAICRQKKNVPVNNTYWSIIFKTVDSGGTWVPLTSLTSSLNTSINMASLDFVDSITGFAWMDNKFYATTDGGDTWSFRNSSVNGGNGLTQIRLVFLDSLTGWIFGGSATIATTDGGYNWNYYLGNSFQSPAQTILLNNNVKAEIECDQIISYGNNNVNIFAGGAIEGNTIDSLILNANLVHSYYNAGIYMISNNSSSALNINVKKISTGMKDRGDVGSSVVITHAGGYLQADEIEAYGTGHCIGHRRFNLIAKVKKIKAGNNSPLFTTYPVYVSQGTGTQRLNLYFDEILAYNSRQGESLDSFAMSEGFSYLKGRSISSGGFCAINMESTNGNGYLIADVDNIMGFRGGIYANTPRYVEIRGATLSASRTAGLNSAVTVVAPNKVFLKNCILYCSNTALGGYSVEHQNGSGSSNLKMINTWSKFDMESGVSATISNLNLNPNV